MLYDILERATAIMNEIADISGAGTFTAVDDIPQAIQDYEGFLAFMLDPSHTQDNTAPKEFPNTITYSGLLIGRQAGLGYKIVNRKNLLRYADAIAQMFNERPALADSTLTGLTGVEWAVFQGGRAFVGPYPTGQNEKIYHQYSFSIQVKYNLYRRLSD